MYTKRVLATLKRARELLARPGAWTQNVWARNAAGKAVNWDNPTACRFSLAGAIRRAAGDDLGAFTGAAIALAALTGKGISAWNDRPGRRQIDAIRVLDRAIEGLEDLIYECWWEDDDEEE